MGILVHIFLYFHRHINMLMELINIRVSIGEYDYLHMLLMLSLYLGIM